MDFTGVQTLRPEVGHGIAIKEVKENRNRAGTFTLCA
jgi:hypothetical protein